MGVGPSGFPWRCFNSNGKWFIQKHMGEFTKQKFKGIATKNCGLEKATPFWILLILGTWTQVWASSGRLYPAAYFQKASSCCSFPHGGPPKTTTRKPSGWSTSFPASCSWGQAAKTSNLPHPLFCRFFHSAGFETCSWQHCVCPWETCKGVAHFSPHPVLSALTSLEWRFDTSGVGPGWRKSGRLEPGCSQHDRYAFSTAYKFSFMRFTASIACDASLQ